MVRKRSRRRNPKFFMGVDARQLAAAFFLVAALIVISALLGRELGLINIIILSAMVVAAMGLGLWYLIFHGLRQAATGNLDLLSDVVSSSPEGRLLTTKDGRFVYANDAYCNLLELPANDAGQTLSDYFAEDTLNFIEWPDKGYGWLPGADIEIRIEYAGEGRKITFSALTEAGQRIIKTL